MWYRRKPIWRSPEDIVEIAFRRASVVMLNEAHDGWRRCIRTRQIGRRSLPVAHQAGVRHLVMEALFPAFAEECNNIRRLMNGDPGYLSQPEMKDFIQTALDAGWTLIPHEADARKWLSARRGVDLSNESDPEKQRRLLQQFQTELRSPEYTNWREEQQARNLIRGLESLLDNTPLLVWCGNSHLARRTVKDWLHTMGPQASLPKRHRLCSGTIRMPRPSCFRHRTNWSSGRKTPLLSGKRRPRKDVSLFIMNAYSCSAIRVYRRSHEKSWCLSRAWAGGDPDPWDRLGCRRRFLF